jgi:hypothetical protein
MIRAVVLRLPLLPKNPLGFVVHLKPFLFKAMSKSLCTILGKMACHPGWNGEFAIDSIRGVFIIYSVNLTGTY